MFAAKWFARFAWRLTAWLVYLVAGLLLLSQLATAGALYYLKHHDTQFVIVTGGSMEPTIHIGSAIILKNPKPSLIHPGVVVTFRNAEQTLTTHRIVSEHTIKGHVYLQTQGDANATPDPDFIPESAVIGVPWKTLPYGGYWANWVTSKNGRIITIAPSLALIMFGELGYIIETLRNPGEETDETEGKKGRKSRRMSRRARRVARKSAPRGVNGLSDKKPAGRHLAVVDAPQGTVDRSADGEPVAPSSEQPVEQSTDVSVDGFEPVKRKRLSRFSKAAAQATGTESEVGPVTD